jgi:hypothetical protein
MHLHEGLAGDALPVSNDAVASRTPVTSMSAAFPTSECNAP